MAMIVRDMIPDSFDSFRNLKEPLDDSGWLGPPSSVPFAWELAPGTPKQEPGHTPLLSAPSRAEASGGAEIEELAIVPVDDSAAAKVFGPDRQSFHLFESGRHPFHFLERAPGSFLAAYKSGDNLLMSFRKGSVPFKWEMEPGIPKDPGRCREFLDCPLTPPPVLHSRSMVLHSGRTKQRRKAHATIADRMRSFFDKRRSSGEKARKLLLSSGHKADSEEEQLSPVSVLEYNSVRFSSASSSVGSIYHSPKESCCWDTVSASSSGRPPLVSNRKNRGGLSSLLVQIQKRKAERVSSPRNGCFLNLHNSNSSEDVASDFNSAKSSSLSAVSSSSCSASTDEENNGKQDKEQETQQAQISTRYESRSDNSPGDEAVSSACESRARLVERVDSLETIDPGFAPSEAGEENDYDDNGKQHRVLNRMASFAQWQRRQASTNKLKNDSRGKGGHLTRNLIGVMVCCYAPREV